METPPVPWIEDCAARLEVAGAEGVPRGDGGAGQGGRFLVAHVLGEWDQAVFVEHDELGEGAVDVAAQGALDLERARAARRASSA